MSNIRMLGVPMDLGASRRGVDMGPYALRYTDLRSRLEHLGHHVEDAGNVPVPFREDAEKGAQRGARYLGAITDVCRAIASQTHDAIVHGSTPLVLGGDHALAAGSIAGAASALASQNKTLGVLWMDAHGDLNTAASSPSGNVHGMPLAALLGHGDKAFASISGEKPALHASRLALVGLRDLDLPEREHIRLWNLHAFTMRSIDERGIQAVLQDALSIAAGNADALWLSLDMDCLDPSEAPGVGTAVPGGMTYREAHLAMEMIADTHKLVGMDLVEVNPVLDEHNRTAEVGATLVLSAFGKQIL